MSHDHHSTANRRRLGIALAIVVVFLIVEVVGAWLTGSLALLGDAGHMFSDALGLVVALIATAVAARPATDRQTYGFRRAEVFGALINGVILAIVAIVVAIEGVRRLIAPEAVHVLAGPMLAVAVAGLAANIAAFLVLRGGRHTSINMRGAYLEVLGDMIGSIAAIVAAGVILLTGFEQADALASLVIAALIVPRAVMLLRDVVHVLSESTPPGMSVAEIREHLLGASGVVDVHDVHVWAITSGSPVFSAHVVVERAVFETGRTGVMLDELGACLSDHFDVAHSTFQLEPAEHADHEEPQHP
ncbi:cation diffusion facilitator family transporter [Salinibacterium sp. ZJ454]|uniref:cation diffusion facilitator family transporter n=1 Tax=Salinibacterium sp. ZJ454 TaxID=2708339 RepID=UPI0014238F1D|nr:cation diffusion facilitator family transporter [Salinibacterium sp. ZJ454]